MKKIMLVVLVFVPVLMGVAGLSGCKSSDVKQVTICTPYMSSVTTKEMVDFMKETLTQRGFKVTVSDSANDMSKLAADIETATVSKVNAIVLVSVDPALVLSQVQEAAKAGISVFGCDSGYVDVMQMNAASNNYQMGQMISKYLFEKMGGKGTLIHLTHRPHPGVVQRTLAMIDVLKDYPNSTLLSEHHVDVPNQISNSKEIVENLLTAYPQKASITAILCAWDEPAIGATQALQEAGRSEVLVVGVDGNEQALKLINEKTNLVATLKQDFKGMANLVSQEIETVLTGGAIEKGDRYVPAILVE